LFELFFFFFFFYNYNLKKNYLKRIFLFFINLLLKLLKIIYFFTKKMI